MAHLAGEEFPDNLACLTCSHVLDGSPIRHVTRDEDGHWQFMCGRSGHETEQARVIGIGEAIALEPRLSMLAPLKPGTTVRFNR